MKKQNLTENFIIQFAYQIIITFIPLLMSPYLTRVIGSKGLGIYSYSFSVAYYFVMFAMLGIVKYGQRLISENRKEGEKLSKAFWSLYSVHAIFSIVSFALYIVFVFFVIKGDKLIYYIQAFYVLSALFDITWFFYGLENFKPVVIKNSVIKIVECALIFLLVKTPNDLWLYTVIVSCGLLLGQIVMIPQAIKIAKPISFSIEDVRIHIKPMIILSIAVVAVSLYTVFDKTLLGLMSMKENVAYYEYSYKIVNIPRAIIDVIGTVTFPRACCMLEQGDTEGHRNCMKDSLIITYFIGCASVFGLVAIADPLVTLYYGAEFASCGGIVKALSPIILIVELGSILRMQYLIPMKLDKKYTFCICLNAVVNLILSFSMIPLWGIYGAVIGTVSAELFGVIYQLRLCREVLSPKEICKKLIPFSIIGVFMLLAVRLVSKILDYSWLSLIATIFCGGLIYISLSLLYLIKYEKEFYNKIMGRLLNLVKRG